MCPTIPLPESTSMLDRNAYCTIGEAKAAGAVGEDDVILADMGKASERVDKFTGDLFLPSLLTIQADIRGDYSARMPYRIHADLPITVTDPDLVTVPATSYVVSSSAVKGARDFIGFGPTWSGHNLLVVGMEPYADYAGPAYVRVNATFGWPEPPLQVVEATAALTAMINRQRVTYVDGTDQIVPVQSADPEGNVLPVVPPFTSEASDGDVTLEPTQLRTTGLRAADQLLRDFCRWGLTGV